MPLTNDKKRPIGNEDPGGGVQLELDQDPRPTWSDALVTSICMASAGPILLVLLGRPIGVSLLFAALILIFCFPAIHFLDLVAWRKRERSRIHDGPPKALIGGQAVQEGVIMRGMSAWAIAVRTPKGNIEIKTEPIEPLTQRHWFWHEPIIRGFAAVRQSSEAGSKAIESIAGAQSKEDEESAEPTIPGRPSGRLSSIYSAITSPLRSPTTLYFLVPLGLTSLIMGWLGSLVLFLLVESLVRAAIWIGFTVARDKEMRRLYEYHGAEHKSISCYEAEDELVPARASSTRACTRAVALA